jgi:CPA2 family monovalent cation:H+ antiporter-2
MEAFAPEHYKSILLFLGTAGVVVPLFRWLKLSPILGFLAAGFCLGPYGLGLLAQNASAPRWLAALTHENVEEIAPVAQFGVVFLLFMIGLELSWERLIRLRGLVFGFGASASRFRCLRQRSSFPILPTTNGSGRRRGERSFPSSCFRT